MNPAKAIEIIQHHSQTIVPSINPDLPDALSLAIASLNLYRTIEEYLQTQQELIQTLKNVTKP